MHFTGLDTGGFPIMATDIVRAFVPDHFDLPGVLGRAREFAAQMQIANTPDPHDPDFDPWRLPDQLTDPALETALEAFIGHDWARDVGRDAHTEIGVRHGRREHMGLYLARGTRDQLDSLTAALATMTTAETTPSAQRLPAMGEVADFVAVWRDQDQTDDLDAALSAWCTVVQILALAVADTPADATPAADTRVLLALVDAGDGRSIELDEQGWAAWRRLCAQWHAVIYGPEVRGADALLASFTY